MNRPQKALAAVDEALRWAPVAPGQNYRHLHAVRAAALLDCGRESEALAVTNRVHEDPTPGRAGDLIAQLAFVRLVRAKALAANGEGPAALATIRAARDKLMERAARIEDKVVRASFLENPPDHAETFRLATAWEASG